MVPKFWAVVGVGAGLLFACGEGDDRASAPSSGGSAGRTNGGDGEAGDDDSAAGAAQGGEGGDRGIGGVGHLGGLGPAASAGAAAEPVCDPALKLGTPQPLAGFDTAADEVLLSITHDELSLAFTRDAELYVADRGAPDDDFQSAELVSVPQGFTHERGAALSGDGLRLVLADDIGGLAELARAARGQPFAGAARPERYATLNELAQQFGAILASPVLSADGENLYYVRITGPDSLTFQASGGKLFQQRPRPEEVFLLGSSDGEPKQPMAVSFDELAIFFFDQQAGHAAGLWRKRRDSAFNIAAQFPEQSGIAPNADCSRFYVTREIAGSYDIAFQAVE
jgi:hypothetical protein